MRNVLVAVAVASALVGGVAGASVALWVTSTAPKKPAAHARSASTTPGADPAVEAALEERVATLEDTLRALQQHRGLAPATAGGTTSAPGAGQAAPSGREAELVDDPVFEAAVRDVMERAEADRDTERELQRDERRKQMVSRWADELAPRLTLSAPQKAKLLDIAQALMGQLNQVWERDGGAPPSREERRAEVQKLRQQAEQKLGGVLDARQMGEYQKLDDDQKLGFPRRPGRDR